LDTFLSSGKAELAGGTGAETTLLSQEFDYWNDMFWEGEDA
jgi:hypothetical protein